MKNMIYCLKNVDFAHDTSVAIAHRPYRERITADKRLRYASSHWLRPSAHVIYPQNIKRNKSEVIY